ncbi:hypothetical protein FXB38_40040 [Bradyrhizobium cytisi]|uniref:Uncharacterized protein n=1 Tax=Bradyrhizobium cytisi TaxID=515489 RepID=A0A5S4VW61_9BRAD|nr:hypothetical protein FXB38_40040 [Bradyrhizobium cytisi]
MRRSLILSSLRAQRSNPESFRGGTLDCFVASAQSPDFQDAKVRTLNALRDTGPMTTFEFDMTIPPLVAA